MKMKESPAVFSPTELETVAISSNSTKVEDTAAVSTPTQTDDPVPVFIPTGNEDPPPFFTTLVHREDPPPFFIPTPMTGPPSVGMEITNAVMTREEPSQSLNPEPCLEKLVNQYKIICSRFLHAWYSLSQKHRKTYATIFSVLSGFNFATSFMLAKLCTSLNGAEIGTVRVVFMVVTLGSYCFIKGYPVFGYSSRTSRLLLFRTMTSVFGSIGAFTSAQLITLPDHTAYQYSAVAFTAIMARIFLKEHFSLVFVLAIACSLLGVVMISKPNLFLPNSTTHVHVSSDNGTTTNSTVLPALGIFCSLLSAFCQSGTYILVRKMIVGSNRLRNVEIIYNFSLFSIPALTLASILWRVIKPGTIITMALDIVYAMISALTGMFAQIAMNMALKQYDASYVSLVRGCDIIFSFIYQATIFNLNDGFITYIGIGFMILSFLIINVYKLWRKHRMGPKELKEPKIDVTKTAN